MRTKRFRTPARKGKERLITLTQEEHMKNFLKDGEVGSNQHTNLWYGLPTSVINGTHREYWIARYWYLYFKNHPENTQSIFYKQEPLNEEDWEYLKSLIWDDPVDPFLEDLDNEEFIS